MNGSKEAIDSDEKTIKTQFNTAEILKVKLNHSATDLQFMFARPDWVITLQQPLFTATTPGDRWTHGACDNLDQHLVGWRNNEEKKKKTTSHL